MRRIFAVALCAGLAGCASVNYIVKEYGDVPMVEVTMPEDTYRVFDRPADRKLMITPSMSTGMRNAYVNGLTLGAANNEIPRANFEAASIQFLQEHGRPGCRVIEAHVLESPQWEVSYDCTPVAAVPAAPPPVRRRGAR
jgi:hypothetical protein